MHDSLSKLAALPDATKVYPAHEYTLSNLHFALTVDPGNPVLAIRMSRDQKLREQNLPTLPSTMSLERASNPFLRADAPAVRQAAVHWSGDRCMTLSRCLLRCGNGKTAFKTMTIS